LAQKKKVETLQPDHQWIRGRIAGGFNQPHIDIGLSSHIDRYVSCILRHRYKNLCNRGQRQENVETT
jgi:hypothetical protein